jgi:hypothetical protein
MGTHVYKLVIQYPAGSDAWDWQPEGYEAGFGSEIFGGADGREFSWPAERLFLSRSGAKRRKALLEGWGAKVTVRQSLRVEWPMDPDGAS